MNVKTGGDVTQCHAVTHYRLDSLGGIGDDRRTSLHAQGREVVTLDTIGVLHQHDVAGAVGIVLDADDRPFDSVAVTPLEIDEPVHLLHAPTDAAGGDLTAEVPAAGLAFGGKQGLFGVLLGHLNVHIHRRVTASGAGLLVDPNRHTLLAFRKPSNRGGDQTFTVFTRPIVNLRYTTLTYKIYSPM